MWAVLCPIPTKREWDGSLFCSLKRHKFFLRLSMISGQFYAMGRFCNFFKTSQSFDQITTLTYVLRDNFLSSFMHNFKIKVLNIRQLYEILLYKNIIVLHVYPLYIFLKYSLTLIMIKYNLISDMPLILFLDILYIKLIYIPHDFWKKTKH